MVQSLYMITPSTGVTITCFGASQRKGYFQRRSRVPSVDEIKRGVTPDSIMRCIIVEGQSLGVLIPVLLVHIRDIHLERPGQCLDHPFGDAICRRQIRHCNTLILTGNKFECAKEIRHEPRFAIMMVRFDRPKSPEDAFFIPYHDRLGCPRCASLSDHVAGKQINPKMQFSVFFK